MPYCYTGGTSPVRDFIRDAWKIAAGCAAGAFLLSLVIGLAAGNPFGVVFFRAVLFALLFGGLGAALRFVITAYLPELVEAGGQAAAADGGDAGARRGDPSSAGRPDDGARRGGTVDIVLPEDDELRQQAYGGSPRPAGTSTAETEGREEYTEEPQEAEELDENIGSDESPEYVGSAEAQALGELAEELDDPSPSAPGTRPRGSRRGSGSAAPGRSPAEEGSLGGTGPADDLSQSAREDSGNLDALPDIAALELPSGRQGPTRSARMSSGDRPEDAVRNMLSGQDPATLARALRTVLKKDEKG
jgi:hypothetical protein